MAQGQPRSEIKARGSRPEFNLGNTLRISESEISDGVSGNLETIEVMKRAARQASGNPTLRRLALNILQEAGVPSHYHLSEALAIADYVKNSVRYVRDPLDIEYVQDPVTIVRDIQEGSAQGDCDDMSTLTAALLLSVGVEPFFRAVRYEQAIGNFNHIYVVVYEKNPGGPKQRAVLDCILKNKPIGTEIPSISGEEFRV